MRTGRAVLLVVVGLAVLGLLGAALKVGSDWRDAQQQQDALAGFYATPDPLPGPPGTVVRIEPLGTPVAGGTSWRMLYVSARPDGTPAVSGAMLFVPEGPAPEDGRPIVAWAHGTVGMGDACAPSRSARGINDMSGWLEQMLSLGWVVVATDYIGLGTAGPELYLVGKAEALDVVNSVRAARAVPSAHAGTRYAVYGHSQGGHSALWTGSLGHELAPELTLVGVAAAAPAAELQEIVRAQWNTAVGWAIGPEAAIAWTFVDPSLPLEGVISEGGVRNLQRIADQCILQAGVEGLALSDLHEDFFSIDPLQVASWADIVTEQTPPPLPASMPVLLAQGTADDVVLAWPNALLQEQWCAAGSSLDALWMGGVNHMKAAITAGPQVVTWIADRFAGRPAPRACDVPPPVSPSPSGQ